jgi:hypothetical protein
VVLAEWSSKKLMNAGVGYHARFFLPDCRREPAVVDQKGCTFVRRSHHPLVSVDPMESAWLPTCLHRLVSVDPMEFAGLPHFLLQTALKDQKESVFFLTCLRPSAWIDP